MEEKKRGFSCSYALLVVILCGALAFVTDYAIIESKTQRCGGGSGSTIVTDNDDKETIDGQVIDGNDNISSDDSSISNENKVYTYADVTGYYKYSLESETGEWFNNISYSIYLFDDATFYMSYHNREIGGLGGIMGNYVLNGNELKLNYLFKHISNGAIIFGLEGSSNLVIDNNVITGRLNFFDGKSVDVNIEKAEYPDENIEHYKIGYFTDKFEMCNVNNNYCSSGM